MVSVTSDIASNASFSNARSKSIRDDQPSDVGSFSSMVDSNTAKSAKDRPDTTPPEAPSPSREEQRPAKADDSAQRRNDRADDAAASNARNQDAQSKTASDRADAADDSKAGRPVRGDNKPDNGKLDKDTKDAKDGKDTKEAAPTDAAAVPAATDKAVPVVAVIMPVVTSSVETAAAPADTNAGATAPLAIAAAVLKAQAAAAEATAATGTEAAAETATPPTTDPDFAALIAAATPPAGKTAAKEAKPATEGTTTESDAKSATSATTATTPQPTQATAADKTSVKTGTGEIAADGAKPDSGNAVAKHAAHERATPDAVQPASTDAPQPTNMMTQQPLQTTTPVVATAQQFTATLAANTPVPLNGVAVEIAQSAQSGKSRFDIRLDPAELGRIDVRLDVDRDGNVTSHLTVEKPETLAMLRQDAPQLQRALEQAGMKTTDGGLQFSLRDQSQGQQQNNGNNSGHPSQRLIISEDDSIPTVSVGRNYGRMLGSSRGVDISI